MYTLPCCLYSQLCPEGCEFIGRFILSASAFGAGCAPVTSAADQAAHGPLWAEYCCPVAAAEELSAAIPAASCMLFALFETRTMLFLTAKSPIMPSRRETTEAFIFTPLPLAQHARHHSVPRL